MRHIPLKDNPRLKRFHFTMKYILDRNLQIDYGRCSTEASSLLNDHLNCKKSRRQNFTDYLFSYQNPEQVSMIYRCPFIPPMPLSFPPCHCHSLHATTTVNVAISSIPAHMILSSNSQHHPHHPQHLWTHNPRDPSVIAKFGASH